MVDHISRVGLFLEVVKHRSFSGAARCLGMTGPALSKQVQSLEDQLGVRLLHRTTRQVTLTEEGVLYSERARQALEDLSEAEKQIQELKATPTGLLRVNAPISFGKHYLAEPIAAFAAQYPEVKLEVDFDDRWVDIIADRYDVVVRIGALEDSSLIARQLASCPIVLCASPAFIEKHGQPADPHELANYPAIIYTKHGKQLQWNYADQHGTKGTVALTDVLGANNAEMMVQACLKGVGVAVLPIFSATNYLQSGQLVRILPGYHTHPQRNLYAMFPQNRHLSIRTRLFVDWLSQACKSLPWE